MSRLAVATVLLCSLPVVVLSQTPPDSGDVVVNEIMYAPSPSTNEFVELYNRSDSSVNLHEIEYADANKNYSPAAPTDTLLSPGAYVVLVRDSSEFESAFPGVNYIEPDG